MMCFRSLIIVVHRRLVIAAVVSIALLLLLPAHGAAAEVPNVPFTRGVNLTNWLQDTNAQNIRFLKFSKKDFENIKLLGCDVIRLPINLHAMTSGGPDYTIDPLLMSYLDSAVDWAEDLGLHLIIDNHSFDPAVATTVQIQPVLVSVWKQLASHLKGRSSRIYYEVLNEPHGIADAVWNGMQQAVIDSIRTIDKKHTIIVGPAGSNSYRNLALLPAYADTNLIYTFHFYDPMIFTHQGASWTNPPLASLSGMPFPYAAQSMPVLPAALIGTRYQTDYQNYASVSDLVRLKLLIDVAVNFRTFREVPIFCGEFGAYNPNCVNAERARWYEFVRSYFDEKGIAWTSWDYRGGFGLFNKGTNELFDYDLNVPVLNALGLVVPVQKPYVTVTDTTGFSIYADAFGPGVTPLTYGTPAEMDLVSQNAPIEGKFCIRWTNAAQYANIAFGFAPPRDLSVLKAKGYALDFWVRTTSPWAQFDVRFRDTKTGPADHQWRMGKYITASDFTWDGVWHHLRIPLASMAEEGSWDSTWYPAAGKFDWKAVERFEIVAEKESILGKELWFDAIRITDASASAVAIDAGIPAASRLFPNYPNPFNPSTTISFSLEERTDATLSVYNVLGQHVATLMQSVLAPGVHSYRWNAEGMPGGMYFCRLTAGTFHAAQTLLLVK